MKHLSGYRLLPCLLLLFFHQFIAAQTTGVTFRIVNEKNGAVPAASIAIVSVTDSLDQVKGIADSAGSWEVELKKNHQYLVTVSAVNYLPVEKGILVSARHSFSITLNGSSQTLNTVVVRSTRPLIHQEDDKTVVDPENLVPSSTSSYEVIEKTPGLFVDQDGNIYINSTTPATIYINGRELKMSTADIATMLKSLPPNAITKIEILRTPSSKYDAAGAGGIVNVVLKKGVKLGLTGSVTTGWQQGKYGNELLGITLNNNSGRISSFVNLNYSKRNNYEQIKTDRNFAPDSVLQQDATTTYPANVYFLGYGASLSQGKWDLSYDGRFSLNDFNNHSLNRSIIEKISSSQVLTNNLADVKNNGSSLVLSQGISSKYRVDSIGSEWTTDLSYTYARNNTDQLYVTSFEVPIFPGSGGDGNSLNKRNFITVQSDISKKLQEKLTIETGIKTSLLDYNSVTGYFSGEGASRLKDGSRTSTFHYKENINAIYLQASKGFSSGFLLKLGTRLENTNMNGRQLVPGDTSFTIHRTDLFPYIYLSHKIISIAGFELRGYLVYRKTISRPVYEQLNPFPRYVDQYLSETGNPSLRPQFTQTYEANISVDETPLLAFGVNQTKDIFTNVIYQSDSSRQQAYRTYDNLGKNKEFYIRGLGAIPPGKKYFFVVGAQYNHNFYQGLYENTPLSFKKGTWTFFTYHTLKFAKYSQVTLNGFIRLKGQQQFYELGNFGAMSASINRQVLKQKLIITLSMNDIFLTNRNDFTINQGSVDASGFRGSDTRRLGVNFRYNFGRRKKEDPINPLNMESPEKSN